VQAQAIGGHMGDSLILGGPDVFGAAEQEHVLVNQLPADAQNLPDLSTVQDASRAALQKTSNGDGILVNYDLNGPFVAYNPSQVGAGDVPATPEAILAWAKAHPGKFAYATPSGSGSGRAFLQALPYLLGDSDPSDPAKGWTRTRPGSATATSR
jgi:putative spermidine/putrescine transport system substrate-binding protein